MSGVESMITDYPLVVKDSTKTINYILPQNVSNEEFPELLNRYIQQKQALVVVWQMQSIIWGKYDNGTIKLLEGQDELNPDYLQEMRIFNEKEELYLRKEGEEIEGRYICDEGSERCEYIDDASWFWGEAKDSATDRVKLTDSERRISLELPVAPTGAKHYLLKTRNYIAPASNGQYGYTDYRFLGIIPENGGGNNVGNSSI